jgi:hypothetical protein
MNQSAGIVMRNAIARIFHHSEQTNDSVPLLRRSSAGRNRLFGHCLCQAVALRVVKCGIAAGMIAIALALGGCGMGPEYTAQTGCPPGYAPAQSEALQPVATGYSNPIFIPVGDPQCAWETVVDVVDDYFRIEHEEPVRVSGTTSSDGNLTTYPSVSPTILEPWRHDTVDSEQRMENTLQTMRRWASVHVTPAQGGYMVEVSVFKELEDMVAPEHSSAGKATFRYDSTLTGVINPIGGDRTGDGWISRGRDATMEQQIIAHLLSRCGQVAQPAGPVVMRGQDK